MTSSTSDARTAPSWRPSMVAWTSNGRAVGGVLLGLLTVTAAVSLLGSLVFIESATTCYAVVIDPRFDMQPGWCTAMRAERVDSVLLLAVVGSAVVVLSLASARWRWWVLPRELPTASWDRMCWALLTPVGFGVPLSLGTSGQAETGSATLQHLGVGFGVWAAWAAASARRPPLLRDHLLAAAAVLAPGVCLVVALVHDGDRHPTDSLRAAFPYQSAGPPFLLVIGTAALFGLAVVAFRLGRGAPNVWVSGLLFATGVAATVIAFVPDLVPAWRGPGVAMEPGRGVWLPLLLTPTALAVVVWAGAAVRPAHRTTPGIATDGR